MSQDTTTLQSMIEQAVTTHQEDADKEQRKAKEKKDREKEEAANYLGSILEPALSEVFRSQINLIYDHVDHGRGGGFNTFAFFYFLEQDWHISCRSSAKGVYWDVVTRKPGNYLYTIETKLRDVSSEQLQDLLLIEMGKHQKAIEQEKEIARARQLAQEESYRQQEEYTRRHYEQREKQERERIEAENALRAQAQQEHNRLTIKWGEAKKKAQQELWQWPAGVVIDIYYLQYCQGSYNDARPGEDEREAEFDYGHGWTITHELNRGGWVTLQPVYEFSFSSQTTTPRTIKLMPHIHYPTWERHIITCTEDLPSELRHTVEFKVPGIVCTYDNLCEDDGYRLCECNYDERDSDNGNWHHENIGTKPVEWVINLIERETNK